MEEAVQDLLPPSPKSNNQGTSSAASLRSDIICIEVKAEDETEAKTCYIEVIHNEEDSSDNYVLPLNTYVPRKLFLEEDICIPEVRDSVQCKFFEIMDFYILDDPLVCNFRPPIYKLLGYIKDLNEKNLNGGYYGVSLDYGKFDINGLLAFQEFQLKEDIIDESIWFEKQDYAKPKGGLNMDMETIKEFQSWLLNFGSNDTVPVKGRVSLKTNEIADLACERWIKDSVINYFCSLVQENSSHTYVVNFSHDIDVLVEIQALKQLVSNDEENMQVLFISPIGIHPDSDETFVSQEHLLTSHYAFASFLFIDKRVKYADTLGLKIPSEFIEKANFILSHFDVEPTYHYCHDPRGTHIEDEPRFISHTCTQFCAKYYPLQTCTNICGIAMIVGLCIAAGSKTDFIKMCSPQNQPSQFAYLKNISYYSHYLRLALMQFIVKSHIELSIISDSVGIGVSNTDKIISGHLTLKRRKNMLNIATVSDLIQDAVVKYTKAKDKPALLLVCQLKSSGKLVTKSFPCSPQGQDDNNCVTDIQRFLNSFSCRDWLSSYVNENNKHPQHKGGDILSECDAGSGSENHFFHPDSDLQRPSHGKEPVRQSRRKNHLDISSVSGMISDARLKFVKIQGKPSLQLGCIIKSHGKSVTKAFPCSALGQDDVDCVSRIQKYINSQDCTEWLNGYMKAMNIKNFDSNLRTKVGYRKNYLDIKNVSHLVSDARMRFLNCKGRPYVQLLCQLKSNGKIITKHFPCSSQGQEISCSVVQKFLNSDSCILWLFSSTSKNIFNIDKVSNLIDSARLKLVKIKHKPMVQLVCQLKSSKKYVKKTFPSSTCTYNDPNCMIYIQDYINSNGFAEWLQTCNTKTSSCAVPINVNNICDLVDEAKLKYQIINSKPTMQLLCHLISKQKYVIKNFPCSSLGLKDSECIAKIQDFVDSINCLSWLYRFLLKNSAAVICNQDDLALSDTEGSSPLSNQVVGKIEEDKTKSLKIKKENTNSSSELSELSTPLLSTQLSDTENELEMKKLCSIESKRDDHPESDNTLLMEQSLDLKNITDLVDEVKLKFVKVSKKLLLCLMCQIKYTGITVKKFFSCSSLNKNSPKLMNRVQSFVNSKKCFKWLSKSISYMDGKVVLNIENISDLIEYSNLKYLMLKGKPVIYLLCRIKSNRKLVRKPFPCPGLGREYVNCISEIQSFVSSSNCRTWLSIHSGSKPQTEDLQSKSDEKPDLEQLCHTESISEDVKESEYEMQLDAQNISALVHGIKTKLIKMYGKSMLKLIFQLKCNRKFITECFPCTSEGLNDIRTFNEVQKFINSTKCLKWLQECIEKYPPMKLKNLDAIPEAMLNENSVDKTEHCLETKSCDETSINIHHTAFKSPIERTLDVRKIQHLIYSAKLIFVKTKDKHLVQLLCQVISTGGLITKNFPCSTLGLNDEECIANIQTFINSPECKRWLETFCNKSLSDIGVKKDPAILCKIPIVGKPEIVFIKPKTLRLVCRLRSGKTKSKAFRCNSKGKNDKEAMQTINDFLESHNFSEWITKPEGKSRSEEEWKFHSYVNTGVDTKVFVDSLTFDVNQRFSFTNNGKFEVIIYRNKGCNRGRLVENPAWGKTHRLDDLYSIKETPPQYSTIAVRLYLTCASKTDECRTECGKLVKNVSIINNTFSCCGHIIETDHCTNCFTCVSPQWCRKGNNVVLCKNCDMYFRTHGTNRPSHLWKESVTTNFKHLKCKWKLRLVLYSDDMSRWHVYRSIYNEDCHDRVVQDRKRPSQCTKDEWCSNKIKVLTRTQKPLMCKKRKCLEEPKTEGSIATQSHDEYNAKKCKIIKIAEEIKQAAYLVECTEETVQYIESYEDAIVEKCIINEELGHPVEVIDYHYDFEETSASETKDTIDEYAHVGETDMEKDKASMVCLKCIKEEAQQIFGCSSKKEMDLHISECHKEELFACAACYIRDNIVVTFASEGLFKEHQKAHAAKGVE